MEVIGILVGIICCLVGFLVYSMLKWKAFEAAYSEQLTISGEYQNNFLQEKDKYSKLLSQKKSSETRLGQISENLVPFLSGCPYNPKDMHFLGNPLDYIVFDLDEGKLIFLEVKSGNSRPSKRQKMIKNLIQTGRVYYEELRINEKGVKIKESKNVE